MARVLAVANQKGGVGKTTTVVNLGAGLAEQGHRVLLVDLDPQAHLTINMGYRTPDDLEPTIYHLLLDHDLAAESVIMRATNIALDFVPANIELAGAEAQLVNELGRESMLKDKLGPVLDRYDYVVIDCPPSLGLLSINAFVASQEVIIPLQCEYFAMKGMQQLQTTIERVRAKLNPQLRISGILPTIHKGRTLHSQEVLQLVRERYGEVVYPVAVKDSIRFAECPFAGQSILTYARDSDGAQAYRTLATLVAGGQSNGGAANGQ